IFEMEELDSFRENENYEENFIEILDGDNNILGIVENKLHKESFYKGIPVKTYKKNILISEKSFIDIVSADPTKKKIYSQWMLNTLIRFFKDDKIDEGKRFILEDLPQARSFLETFDGLKKTKQF